MLAVSLALTFTSWFQLAACISFHVHVQAAFFVQRRQSCASAVTKCIVCGGVSSGITQI